MRTRVLVCGSRDFTDRALLFRVLDAINEGGTIYCVIHGAARGADRLADEWAALNQLPIYRFHAHWKKHRRAAGPIRNQNMLEKGQPDLVVAFPGGAGTKDMMRRALAANVKVLRVDQYGKVTQWFKRVDVEQAIERDMRT